MAVVIRNYNPVTDTTRLLEIYNHYVKESIVTFDLEAAQPSHFEAKVSNNHPFIVLEVDQIVCGYAYSSMFRSKRAFDCTAEISIYLHKDHLGNGYGSMLLKNLLDRMKGKFHTVVAGLSLPNPSSVRLHQKFGFEKVAHFKRVGFKFNKYIDVAFYQLVLEYSILSL